MQGRRYADAVVAYRSALEGVPRDAAVRLKLADALLATGDWGAAALETLRAADLRLDDLELQTRAAALLATQGRFIDARDRADLVLAKSPGHVGALIVRANATAEQPFANAALLGFERASRAGRRQDVDQRQQRAMSVSGERDADAEKTLRRALAIEPTHSTAQLSLANLLFATGRQSEAAAALQRMVDTGSAGPVWPYVPYDAIAAVPRLLGEWYAYSGREDAAERYLRQAVDRGDAEAMIPLADVYSAASRDREALDLLRRVPAQFDGVGDVALRIARIEMRTGHGEAAWARLDALLKRVPGAAPAVLAKAELKASQQAWRDVVTLARESLSIDPSSGDARLLLSQALQELGRRQEAFEELREAVRRNPADARLAERFAAVAMTVGRADEAVAFARDAVRQRPDDPGAMLVLARALTATGDYRGAEQELKRLLAKTPDSPQGLTQLGTVQAARGDQTAARATLTHALQLAPQSLDALSALVSLEMKGGRIAAGRQLADTAVASHPRDPRYLLLAARAAEATSDVNRSETLLRQVLDVDRQNIQAVLALARVLSTQGRRDEAIGLMQHFSRDTPATDVRTSLGLLLEQEGRAAEAQALYEKIVADDEQATTASLRLAAMYLRREPDLDRALDLATTVRNRLPDDPAANDLLGSIYVKKDLAGHAVPYFQAAVRSSPNSALYHFHLGQALQEIGQAREARTQFNRALELDPNFGNASEARAALGLPRR